ncbi:MAG: DUF4388 domain-containing protein [Verrucomicrobiae bacterium]|nr:DUF4388 domain-containing protein [Verrucomicrobiae bacterium]
MGEFALRIVTGPKAGQEFELPEGREVIIGRLDSCDVVLDDPNVSRRHASVTVFRGEVSLRDLDSRNGTFFNRQRIRQALLLPGDLFTVGTTVLRLIKPLHVRAATETPAAPAGAAPSVPKPAAQTVSLPSATVPGMFRGSLKEIALLDVLQLLSSTRKSGVLIVKSGTEAGEIFLHDGRIYYARMRDGRGADPRKVLYRLLRWTSGSFELEKSDLRQFANPITEPTDVLLLEGARQLDELARLGDQVPPLDATVRLATPLPGRLSDLAKEELDFLQLVVENGTVGGVLDRFPGSDVDGYSFLLKMVERKYVSVHPAGVQREQAAVVGRPQ